MYKIVLVLLFASFGVMGQDLGVFDKDTTKVPRTGLTRFSEKNGKVFFRNATGSKKEVVSTNNSYANPSWIPSLALAKITGLQDSLSNTVKKVTGKSLSANDFTDVLKTKLDGIATGATANSSDATLLSRVNHTGTQAISTVTGLQPALDAKQATIGYTTENAANKQNSLVVDGTGVKYTTVDATNSGLATKQASLGYTPYNSTNPNGYISSYTETDPTVKLLNGIIKSNGTTISAATAGTDYALPNATNTQYASDYRAANFVAGTNYLAPNGSAAALTSFPTFNQNTTGNAGTATALSVGADRTKLDAITGTNTGNDATNTQYSGLASSKENSLGNPVTNGYILSSTTGGTRSWVAPPTGGTWGAITGTLSSQTDLQSALDLKANLSGATFTGNLLSSAKLLFGVTSGNATRIEISSNSTSYAQSSAQISVRATGTAATQNNIEWGHQVTGLGGNLGAESNSGDVVIVLNGELGTTADKYTTRSFAGNVIKAHSTGGHLSFNRLTSVAGVNQSLTESMRITGNGNVLMGSTTDSGEKFQVTGTSKFAGDVYTDGNTRNLGSSSARWASLHMNAPIQFYAGSYRVGAEYIQSPVGTKFGTAQTNAVSSAQLEIESTTKGFLPPRMTTALRNAVATPVDGLLVYDTDISKLYIHNGTNWGSVGAITGSYSQTGAATTTFTVTLPTTMPNTTYTPIIEATSMLAAGMRYVQNQTTTTFDVVYTTAITGSVTFKYAVFR